MRLRGTSALAAAAAMAVAFSLSACANPVETLVKKGATEAIERATGADVDLNGEGVSLPADWPDIPTPDAKPTVTMKVQEGFSAVFQIDQEEADRVLAEFAAQGWEESNSIEAGEGRILSFSKGEDTVALTLGKTEEGVMMNYIVPNVSGN